MKTLKDLNSIEMDMLLKAPAYITLLAANDEMDEEEKEEAFHLTHIKSFSTEPMLRPYYREAEKRFKENVERLNRTLPQDIGERRKYIEIEFGKILRLMQTLGKDYAIALQRSFTSYAKHISRAHQNVMQWFVLPLTVKGLNDE